MQRILHVPNSSNCHWRDVGQWEWGSWTGKWMLHAAFAGRAGEGPHAWHPLLVLPGPGSVQGMSPPLQRDLNMSLLLP